MNRDEYRSSGKTPQNAPISVSARKDSSVATLARHSGAGYANGTTNSREGEEIRTIECRVTRAVQLAGWETRPSRRRRHEEEEVRVAEERGSLARRGQDGKVETSRRRMSFAEQRWKSGVDKYEICCNACCHSNRVSLLSAFAFTLPRRFLYCKRGR